MKIRLKEGFYATNEGTGFRGKCKNIGYLWIGSDTEVIGTLEIKQLRRLVKAISKKSKSKV